jgi:YVTN family beta-propeller protein
VLRAPLPLSGEYAVTANLKDRTLSVIPIGLSKVVATVPLDIAPHDVATAPNSDRAFATDASSSGQAIALASLDATKQVGNLDPGSHPDELASPPAGASGPLLVVTDTDDTIRSLDPTTQALGQPLKLGAGPHAVAMAMGGPVTVKQVYVTNAGDGTVSVIDAGAAVHQGTIEVGGRPIGVAATSDGGLWSLTARLAPSK